MIKKLDQSKIGSLMEIWLEENIRAHDFIPRTYWESNYAYVKSLLPAADVFLYEDRAGIKGFIGILESSYIAGLFVSHKYQSRGIGRELLIRTKEEYPSLKLDVYAKNVRAVNFYRKNGFKIEEEKEDRETGEAEYSMLWKL